MYFLSQYVLYKSIKKIDTPMKKKEIMIG
jgi:hypothetical protein